MDAYRQKLVFVDVGLALLSHGISTETLSLLLLPRLLKVSTPCSQYVAGGEGYSLRSFIITNVAAVSRTAKIPLPLNLSGRLHQIGNCFVEYGSLELAAERELLPTFCECASFLNVVGKKGMDMYETFQWDNPSHASKIDKVVEKCEERCVPARNERYERYFFFKSDQLPSESPDSYITALMKLSESCG